MKSERGRTWRLSPRHLAVWLVVAAIGGSILSYFSGLPYWGGMAIVAAALVANGVVAEVEDRSSGEYLNPREKPIRQSAEPPSDA